MFLFQIALAAIISLICGSFAHADAPPFNSGSVATLGGKCATGQTQIVQYGALTKCVTGFVNATAYGADPSGVTDSTAAINAALAALSATTCLYLPTGQYQVTDALNDTNVCIVGDDRTLSVLNVSSATFNLSAKGVIVIPPNGGATPPVLKDFGITFTQPDTGSRGSIVAFPPGIYMQDTARPILERLRIGGGSYCIDARGNTGGLFLDKIECGSLVTGLQLGGPGTYPGATHVFTITGGSYAGSTATVTGAWGTGFGPTVVAVVTGASPSCLNGSWPITSSGSGTISFTDAGCSIWTSGGTVSSAGAADGIHVVDWHEWDFGFSTSGLLSIYADGTNQCMVLGRVDWGGYANIQCWQTQIVENYDAENATGDFSSWANVVLDQGGWIQAGGKNLVSNFTAIGPVSFSSVNVSGGYLDINNFTLTPGPAPVGGSVNVSGGTLIMSGGVKMTANSATSPTVLETGGTFGLFNSAITAGARSPSTDPIISQTGGVIVMSGNWFVNAGAGATGISVTADVAGSAVLNNFLNGFIKVVPFSATETQYGMNETIGSLSSTTGTNINLLTGAGQNAWFTSQVSGFSGWKFGENSGGSFSIRDGSSGLDSIQALVGGAVTFSGGGHPTLTTGSCSGTSAVGTKTIGTFVAATCAGGTYILSALPAATNGWTCDAEDRTVTTDLLVQTAATATSATLTGTTANTNVVQFKCFAY